MCERPVVRLSERSGRGLRGQSSGEDEEEAQNVLGGGDKCVPEDASPA